MSNIGYPGIVCQPKKQEEQTMFGELLNKIIALSKEIKDATQDGKLSDKEAHEILDALADLLISVTTFLPAQISTLLKGIASAIKGIGYIIDKPDQGVDELLVGMADMVDGVRAMVPSYIGFLLHGIAELMRGTAKFIRETPKK